MNALELKKVIQMLDLGGSLLMTEREHNNYNHDYHDHHKEAADKLIQLSEWNKASFGPTKVISGHQRWQMF